MLEEFTRWAEIDLDAIAHNVTAIKRLVGERVKVMAVVKANAYGHGLVPVAQVALQNGASWLAVTRVSEGMTLRCAGIRAPILVMGYSPPASVSKAVEYGLTLTLSSLDQARALAERATRAGKTVPVHLKVDTGMGRFGLLPGETVEFAQAIQQLPGLILEGVYTHLAVADSADQGYTRRQLRSFQEVTAALEREGIRIPVRHAANSAATLAMPESHLDAVRAGIAIYGLRPSEEVEPTVPLRPALTLKSRVGRVSTLPAGSSISYGCTYVTQRPTRLALVMVGYGDGYMRLASNRGVVLIHGQRAPIRGRICMDQFVVEVSHIEHVSLDDEVVLIGRQGDKVLSAEEIARWSETINYEVVTQLSPHVPRVYMRGRHVEQVDIGNHER